MTVLRSREIVPLNSVSPKTLRGELIEPLTPVKGSEPFLHHSSPSASPLASDSQKLRSGSGPTSRRRSMRLASKLSSSDDMLPDSSYVGQEQLRSRTVTQKESPSSDNIGGKSEHELNSVLIKNRKEFDATVSGSMVVGARVSDSSGRTDAVVFEEPGIEMAGELKEIEEDVQMDFLNQVESGRNADVRKNGKRKSGDWLCLGGQTKLGSGSEVAYLSLRSGTKIAKRMLASSCGAEEGDVDTLKLGDGAAEEVKYDKGKKVLVEENCDEYSRIEQEMGDVISLTSTDELKLTIGLNYEGMDMSNDRGRLTREEKGKCKLDEILNDNSTDELKLTIGLNYEDMDVALSSDLCIEQGGIVEDVCSDSSKSNENLTLLAYMSSQMHDYSERRKMEWKKRAKENAYRLAHFSEKEMEGNATNHAAETEVPLEHVVKEIEDWPGPFSTAFKIIKDREKKATVQEQYLSRNRDGITSVNWTPRKEKCRELQKPFVPSLVDLSIAVLAKNADAITSLDNIPYAFRHKLSQMICDSRKMNDHFLDILLKGSPLEIRIRDCSWLTEEQFTRSFEVCNTENLMVLQLDQCGRCMADYILQATLASKSLCALTTVSLKGACRLSDDGLAALVSAAPSLRSLNLSQCSLLTAGGIYTIANSLGSVLRELYLDDCQSLDALLILPAFAMIKNLEVLSLAGIQSICNEFMQEFITLNGRDLKELILANCIKLTDPSIKTIANTCSDLRVLDLSNMCKLTDLTMGYLANGCCAIQTLKCCRNAFSDEAVAAFIETSGESLKEFSLNNVHKVGHNTAISIARRCRNMICLDLSWCRNLTDGALGLIADSCLSLRVLKVFGCTQISWTFVNGHTNPILQVIGLKLTPILENLKEYDHHEGPLRYSTM